MAIRSGIPVREWLAGDPRELDTALDLLIEESREAGYRPRGRRVVASG